MASAGLPKKIVPKAWRHTFLTTVLAGNDETQGVSLIDAAALAGHSYPAITARVYAKSVWRNMERSASLADNLLTPKETTAPLPFPASGSDTGK